MLKEKIEQDFKVAFKEKRVAELSTLKMLKAALQNKEKEKQYQEGKKGGDPKIAVLGDDEIINVVGAEIKKLRDSIALFEKGSRSDLAGKAQQEISVLLRYLPEQMDEVEVKKLVEDAIKESGAASVKDMSKAMAILMPKIKGKADAGLASQLVKEALE